PSARLLAAARPLPKRLRREVDRRHLRGLPTTSVKQVTTFRDLAQRAVRMVPRSQGIAQRLEDSMKAAFDRSVARRLDAIDYDAVIGISGSSEMTLRAASAAGRLGILHLTDSHPAAKNRYLRELGGLPAGHPELVAEYVRARMERELEEAGLVLVPSRFVADQLAANVTWKGSLGRQQIAEEMRGADVLLLPSLEDAFGLVTMEAMASGLPVVVSDHCGSSELVADGAAGIVIPAADTTALENAIRRLLEEPERRRAMGYEARRRMVAGRSWESYGQYVLDRIGRQ